MNKMFNFSRITTRRLCRKVRLNRFSTDAAVVEKKDAELQRTIEKITKITMKEVKKKPQRPPFAKNFFLGVCDTDLLAYPEVLDKKQVESLESDLLPIKDFYENVNRDEGVEMSKYYLENLRDLRLLGLQAPSIDGGRQLSVTETCRFYEEIAKADSKIGVVQSEQLGLKILLKYSKPHFKKDVVDLVEGKSIAAFCINEANISDNIDNKTNAVLSSDGKYWVLNGNKRWIVNGDIADIFIVITETEVVNKKGLKEKKIIALLVRRTDGGIISKPCDMIGLNQTDIANVSFSNTPIPIENILVEFDSSDKEISSILSEHRLSTAPINLTILKKVINEFLKHCINTTLPEGNLADIEVIQSKIGELTTSLYAIESLTYLTAGLIDQYENQDCELEAAISKVFSVEHCSNSILQIMNFVGSATLEKNNFFNRLYRDSLSHMLLHESLDGLKIIIALLGLQHAGKSLNENIKIMRNPIFHPTETLKRMWTQRQHLDDNPKLILKLNEYLHPSLQGPSQDLEYCILRLKFATETLLTRYGPDVIGKHTELKRMADSIVDTYTIAAVLARANRSYCIGLQHAGLEMEIAAAFTVSAMERVKVNINKVISGPYHNLDQKYLNVGKYCITNKQYCPVNPLSRIF